MEDKPDRGKRSETKKATGPSPSLLSRIKPNAAGIDCGSMHHHVAVPADRDPEPVRRFKTFTPDLRQLAEWLVACGIEDAMVTDESSVSDFRPSWSPKDGPENDAFYAEVSKNIGFKVVGPDTIYGLAARLRGTS